MLLNVCDNYDTDGIKSEYWGAVYLKLMYGFNNTAINQNVTK